MIIKLKNYQLNFLISINKLCLPGNSFINIIFLQRPVLFGITKIFNISKIPLSPDGIRTIYFGWDDFSILVNIYYHEEFLLKFGFPVSPKLYTTVFDATPTKLLIIHSSDLLSFWMRWIFVLDQFPTNKKSLTSGTTPASRFYRNSKVMDIKWNKFWLIGNKYS